MTKRDEDMYFTPEEQKELYDSFAMSYVGTDFDTFLKNWYAGKIPVDKIARTPLAIMLPDTKFRTTPITNRKEED